MNIKQQIAIGNVPNTQEDFDKLTRLVSNPLLLCNEEEASFLRNLLAYLDSKDIFATIIVF